MRRDKHYPHTSVKGSRRSRRTSGRIRARDWHKSWRMYIEALEKLRTLSSLAECGIDIAERQEHNL